MKPATPKTELPLSTQLRKAVFGGSHMSPILKNPCFTSLLSRLVCCLWCLLPTIPTAAVQLQYESQSSSIAYSMTAFADVGGVTDLQSWQGSGFLDTHTIVAQAGKMVDFVPYVAYCSAGVSIPRLETGDPRSDMVTCISAANGIYGPSGNWRGTATATGTFRWSVVPSQGEPVSSGPRTLMLMLIVTNSPPVSVSGTWTLSNLTITVKDQVWGPYTCAINLSSGVIQGTIPPQSITNVVTMGDTISVSFQTELDCGPTGPVVGGATAGFTIALALPVSCADLLHNAITFSVTPSGKGVVGTFTPNSGASLQDAAAICGVDHFNWVNMAISDDDPERPTVHGIKPNLPYIDPPYGGWDYQAGGSDSKIGYWNEDNGQLQKYTTPDLLVFEDYPGVTSGSVRFRTYLVGVDTSGRQAQVMGDRFEWECASHCTIALRQNTNSDLIAFGAVTVTDATESKLLSDSEKAGLATWGIGVPQSVSEQTRLRVSAISEKRITLQFVVLPGFTYDICKSRDLLLWSNCETNISREISSWHEFSENVTTQTQAFYRVLINRQ